MPDGEEEQFELHLTITNPDLAKKLKSLSARKRSSEIVRILEENLLAVAPEKSANKAEPAYDKLEFENLLKRVRILESILKTLADKITRLEAAEAKPLIVEKAEEVREDNDFDPLHNDVVNTVNPENLFNKLNGNFL